MSDKELLAQYVSSEIHGEDDYVRVYGSRVQDDGRIYIEGDIDGAYFSAVLSVDELHVLDDDDDFDGEEDDGE